MTDRPTPSGPSRPQDYRETLVRRESAHTTPREEHWLMSRGLAEHMAHAGAKYARGRLLDVGCGGRPYEELFLPRVTRYIGLDTPASVTSRIDVGGLASELPIAGASMDTVLCTEVIEHVPDPAAAVREMARVLRPGGHLILTTPQMWALHEEPYDYYRYTKYSLAHLCRAAGLEVLEIRPHGGPWAIVGVVLITHLGEPWRKALARFGSRSQRAAPGERRLPWPLKIPLVLAYQAAVVLTNRVFGALDRLPHPGVYALGNMVIARKRE